jgi:hypothetical protein
MAGSILQASGVERNPLTNAAPGLDTGLSMVSSSREQARGTALVALLLLAHALRAHAGDARNPWDQERFQSDQSAIEQLAPRLEGTGREAAALAYVRDRLAALGAQVREISYADSPTVHSFSAGLEASVAGTSPGTLLIVVPVDHAVRPSAGRDGSAGVALGLAAVAALLARPPALSCRVLFLGAEHGTGADYPIGSRRYLEGYQPEGPVAVLYLDLRSAPARLRVLGGSNGIVSPQWLVERLTKALRRAGLPFRLRGNESQVLRLGVASDAGTLAPFLQAGLPTIGLTDADEASRPSTPSAATDSGEFLEGMGNLLAGLTDSLGQGIPEEWDRHYLLFQIGGTGITVPERTYIVALAALVAACLLYAVLSGRRGRRYAVAFLEGLWSVPLHLALLALYALAATLAVEGLLAALDFPTLWQQAPLQLLLMKVLVGVSLFVLVTPLVTRAPFPRSDSFYAAAAIVFLVAGLVGTAVYEVSLAYYLAWALVFTLASSAARDRSAKILLFAVAPAWLLRAAIELFWLRELAFVRLVILDRLWGNLFVAAAVAPYYFMALRLRMLLPARRQRRRRLIVVTFGLACLAAASATAAWVGYLRPYQDGDARPISARATLDYESGVAELELECPIAIREYSIATPAGSVRTATRARRATAAVELAPDPLAVTTSSSAFLDRRNVSVTLTPSPGSDLLPYELGLRLLGSQDFVLYDSTFPFARDPSGREYTIRVGVNPPSPLELQLTLPRGLEFELEITARYLQFPQALVVSSPGAVIEPWLRTRSVHSFGT